MTVRTKTEGVGEQGAEYIPEPKKKDVSGDWRKMHTEKLYDLYCSHKYNSGHQSRKDEKGEACGRYILSLEGGGGGSAGKIRVRKTKTYRKS
jgi:hypothetical protein